MKRITFITASVLFLVTLYVSTRYRYPEMDELYFADAPIKLIMNGGWRSHIVYSQFFYQPLHAFLLVPWLLLWGISHLSVCGFGVLWGFLSCLLLVKYANELKYIESTWQEILLVVGFWAFNTFTDYETFGRPDNLGMLLTLIALRRFLEFPNVRNWEFFIFGVIIISVGVYEIPVIAFFFLFMIIRSFNNKTDVLRWIKKVAIFGSGVILGELLVCIFFLFNRGTSLRGYIYYTFFSSMNANASSTESIINRLYEAYSANWYITIIFVLFLMIMLYRKIDYNKYLALFIVLLPALMVFAGRFVPYYSWIYYIPIIVFVVYYLKSNMILALINISLFALSSIIYFATQWYTTYGCQANTIIECEAIKNKCDLFFSANKDLISEYDNVVISEEQLYYDIVNTKAEVWLQYKKNPYHKMNFYYYKDMERSLKPISKRRTDKYINYPIVGSIVKCYKEHDPQIEYFPQEGICIYTCDYEKRTSLKFMTHFGYKYECLNSNGDFSIYKFSKK